MNRKKDEKVQWIFLRLMRGRKINKDQLISGEIDGTRKIGRQHLLKPGDRNLLQEFVWNQLFNTSHAWVKVGGRSSRFMWNLAKSALLPGFNRSCLLIFHTPTSIDLYRLQYATQWLQFVSSEIDGSPCHKNDTRRSIDFGLWKHLLGPCS